jgi:Tfp pilus assembly protein PilN
MIEINLIPSKVKKQKTTRMFITGAVFAGGLAAAALVGIVVYQQSRTAKVEAEIKKIDAESASLRDKIDEVIKFRGMEEMYNKKKAVIDKLLSEQSLWAEILDKIGEMVLPDMWLTAMAQDKVKDEGIVLKVSGESLSKVIVADFIKRLERSPKILELTATQIGEIEKKGEGITTVAFDVSFIYRTGNTAQTGGN